MESVVKIELTRGMVAIVDACDYPLLSRFTWYANSCSNLFYAWNNTVGPMHRLIIGATKGQFVDHRDGNTLNNSLSNLRFCSEQQNVAMLTIEQHAALVERADAHRKADEYISGTYGDWPRGACAIGCSIYDCQQLGILNKNTANHDHAALAKILGVPEMVLRLEDHIFEGLSESERAEWPPRFLRAIQPGKDYSSVPAAIMARLADRLADVAMRDDVEAVCRRCAEFWRRRSRRDDPSESEWKALWEQADAAREQSYAARKQAYAAWKQAYAARKQAYAARKQFWIWCAEVVVEEMVGAA